MDYAIDSKETLMTERFSASRAAQLMACPGSANLELSIPGWTPPVVDPEKGAKGKGHTLHEFLQQTSEFSAKDLRNLSIALAYVADLRSRRRFKVLAEVSREATWLQARPKTTVDLVLYVQDELHIIDWKTGKIPVFADDNEQGLFYALTYADLAPKAKGATIHIVQPWAANDSFNGISSWYADTNTLMDFMQRAVDTEQQIMAGSTKLNPSDNCKFCPANPHTRGDKGYPLCPAMMQMMYPLTADEDEILSL